MTTERTNATDAVYLANAPKLRAHVIQEVEKKNRHIMKEAEERFCLANREGLCALVGASYSERSDDEGGGHVEVLFPDGQGWTVEGAETYASRVLGLSLGSFYGGAGRMFGSGGGWRDNKGRIGVTLSWGLDI